MGIWWLSLFWPMGAMLLTTTIPKKNNADASRRPHCSSPRSPVHLANSILFLSFLFFLLTASRSVLSLTLFHVRLISPELILAV